MRVCCVGGNESEKERKDNTTRCFGEEPQGGRRVKEVYRRSGIEIEVQTSPPG